MYQQIKENEPFSSFVGVITTISTFELVNFSSITCFSIVNATFSASTSDID